MIINIENSTSAMPQIVIAADGIRYTQKPTGGEIGSIRDRLSGNNAHRQLDLLQLAHAVENGQTIQGALLRDKLKDGENTDERFIKQQIFAVDIDNDYKSRSDGKKYKVSSPIDEPEEIKAIAEKAGLTPCIISESFSSGTVDPNGEPIFKYHVLFAAESPVTDVTTARQILLNLMGIFGGKADKACKDPARILFGTTKDKKILLYNAVNSVEALLKPFESSETLSFDDIIGTEQTKHSRTFQRKEADPDKLLVMIDPNNLDYNEWLRVSASYKSYTNADFAVWESWNNQYSKVKPQSDQRTYKGLTSKGVTAGTLKKFAKLHSPDNYNSYIAELNRKEETPVNFLSAPKQTASPQIPTEKTQYNQPSQWEEIKPFESAPEAAPFPLDSLPPLLRDYLKAVADYSAVSIEMGLLPLLSVLSLCLQGKAVVNYPGNEHLEPLCLYTLTVAEPGERKTAVFNELLKPLDEFEKHYNNTHKTAIKDYEVQKQFYKNQLNRELNSKNGNLQKAKQIQHDLDSLEPVQSMKLYLTDTTPEALARELANHGEKMGIMGDEATILKILGGVYSKNGVNYDIILNCYDGKKYTLSRQTSDDITLFNPLLTISAMVQPKPFKEAMSNPDFSGKGLLQRFLFAFPPSKAGYQPFQTPNIPVKLKKAYSELITDLLRMQHNDPPPILKADKEAYRLFEDYHDNLQHKMRSGGMFDNMKDYANKQLSKTLRIAALLHLTEHKPTERISGKTALNAISISLWFENQALKAFEFDSMSDTEKVARYICKRLQKSGKTKLEKYELLRLCRKYKSDELTTALELLDEMNIICYQIERQEKGRPIERIIINPELKYKNI